MRGEDEVEAAKCYRRAEEWATYIRRGASGRGSHGSESTSEYLLVEAAGAVLPSGTPVLMLLNRFSMEELADIRAAMDLIGYDQWYWAPKQRAESSLANKPIRSRRNKR